MGCVVSTISIDLTDDEFRRIALAAHLEDVTLNEFVYRAVSMKLIKDLTAETEELRDLVTNLEEEIRVLKLDQAEVDGCP